ncbi:MAG: glycosyltransferase [Patescibacteria group bacterium]|nr:glycosyltransferase [Patescibacteria group bacterium]
MKICLINNLYKPFNRGGAEKVSGTIANGLVKAGHEVFIITTKPRGKKLPADNAKLQIYYLKSYYYNLNKLPKFFRFFWHLWNMFNFVSYFKIKNILQKEKCQAVITNNLMGIGFLTPLAIRSLKIKHLHIAHDIQLIHPSGLIYYGEEGIVDGFFSKIYANMCRALFNSPSAVIFPSRWLKALYTKKHFFSRSKISILPNPVEAAPGQIGERAGFFKFLFLGQVEKHKGVFLLINAFNKIKEKYPEVELLLAGDGSEIGKARRIAKENNNIKFLDWPGDEAADKLLFSNDCLVYPSLVYENCPNAIQRALMAGLPVLAGNFGGIPELLNQNAGILFKPADIDDLAKKMARMVENKNSFKILAQINFNVENYIKKLEEMIKL